MSVTRIVKESFFSWQTLLPTAIYLVVWTCLIGWSVARTAYLDHVSLVSRNGVLQRRVDQKDQELIDAEIKRQTAEAKVPQLQKQLEVRQPPTPSQKICPDLLHF